MSEAVTRLIVDADGALRTLDAFEHGMEAAGKASANATGAVSSFEKSMAALNDKRERGLAVTTQSIERISKEQRVYQNYAAQLDPVYKLRIRLEREAAQASVAATNAVILGYETQEGALRTLTMMEQRHAAQLAAAASAANPAVVATNKLAAATNKLAVANDNASGHTANLAAQFQDIAVTAAMGMSPMQIALQQGAQISAVLGLMGAAGSVRALGAALLSVVNPVSLVTIGLVAAGAAAVQYFTSAEKGAGKANALLDEQTDVIRRAASAWGELVPRLQEYVDQLDRAKSIAEGRAAADIFALKEFDGVAEKLSGLKREFGAAMRDLRGVQADPAFVRDFGDAFGDLREKLADGTATSGDYLKAQNAIAEAANQYGTPAVLSFRDAFETITGSIQHSIEAAKTVRAEWIKAIAGGDNVQDIISQSTFLDGGKLRRPSDFMPSGNIPVPQSRPKIELEGLPSEEKQINKLKEGYDELIRSAGQRIEQMQAELDMAGRSGAASEAYRYEQDLLSQAIDNAARSLTDVTDATERWRLAQEAVTPEQREEIHRLAEAYGALALQIAEATAKADLLFERDQIGRDRTEQRVATELRRIYGEDYQSQMGGAIAGQIRLNEQWRTAQDELKAVGDIGKDALGGLLDLLYQSGDATEQLISLFAGIGKQFAQMGLDKMLGNVKAGRSIFDISLPSVPSSQSATGGLGSLASANKTAALSTGREIGAAVAPVVSDRLNSSLASYAAAIRKIESGSYAGNYGAIGPVTKNGDRAYGAYQVMGNNIGAWTKEVLGQSMSIRDFLADRSAQDRVFFTKFGQSLERYGNAADAISVHFSGRPVSRAGNASDGYNTVPQYVSKVQSAYDAYPGSIKQGVSEGTVDGLRKAARQQDAHVQAWQQAQGGGNAKLEGLLGVGSAAFGAFAGGYQSGSPLMGGISGAMSGFGAAGAIGSAFPALAGVAGPIGLVGGALLGIFGGILGRSKQKKQELEQARQELEGQMGAITDLMASATGNFAGAFSKQLFSVTDELNKAIKMAEKAKNDALALKLKDAMAEFFDNLEQRWKRGFDGMVKSMESGNGLDGAFLTGMDAVEKMRESLIGFVNDAKMFADAGGDLAGYYAAQKEGFMSSAKKEPIYSYQATYKQKWSGRGDVTTIKNELVAGYLDIAKQMTDLGVQAFTATGGQLYQTVFDLKAAAEKAGLAIDEQGKVTRAAANDNEALAGSVERARQAAVKTALAMLTGAEEFTATEQAIQKLQGTAANLPSLLSDLGLSAQEAGKAIKQSLTQALDTLRRDIATDVQRNINDASGFGYLNDFADAQASYKSRLKDLAAIGIDSSAAVAELSARLRQISGDLDLTDDQFRKLSEVFPEIGGAIAGLIGMGGRNTSAALAKAKADLDEAKSNLQASYDAEKSKIEQVISKHQALTKSLQQFMDNMKLDSALSPLDPYQRLQEAQKQFAETSGKALGGDADALEKLPDVARNLLTEAKAYYATSEAYFSIFNDVQKILNQALGVSGNQLSEAEKQLSALNALVNPLLDIKDGTLSVTDAINAFKAAQSDADKAKAAQDAYQNSLFEQMLALMRQQVAGGTGANYDRAIAYLNANPDVFKAIQSGQTFGTGSTDLSVLAKAHWDQWGQYENRPKAYADGGMHSGGLRLVGERGPELEATGPSRIWTFDQTRDMLGRKGDDNAALIAEVRALRQELAGLKDEMVRNTGATVAGAQAQVNATDGVGRAVAKSGDDARRVKYQRGA